MKYLGIFLVILGVVMAIDLPLQGVISIVLGVYLIRREKNKKQEQPQVYTEPAQQKPQDDGMIVEVRHQSQPKQSTKKETIRVAGISFYTDAVESLGFENEEYHYNKRKIIDEYLEDEKIWQYSFAPEQLEFVSEPENKYDPNAIAVYIDGKQIGYVEKELTAHIREIMENEKLVSATCDIVGGKYKMYDSVEEEIVRGEINYGARITLEIKN